MFQGIKSKLLDFQASSFMIISQLVVKETFNFNSLDLIVNSTAKHCLPQLHKQALQMLSLLCHNQEKLNHLNERYVLAFSYWLLYNKYDTTESYICFLSMVLAI